MTSDRPAPRAIQVTFDCADPRAQARFWSQVMGYVEEPPPPGFDTWEDALQRWGVPQEAWGSRAAAVHPEGGGPRLFFQQVPEGKVAKNRVHLDVRVGGTGDDRRARIDREAERLVGLGASVLRVVEEWGGYTVVMQDPEGNEFCLD